MITAPPTTVTLRRATTADADPAGRICYDAFTSLNIHHRFPPDFPNIDATVGLLQWAFSLSEVYGVVAEREGKIIGSNVLWEDAAIAGVGPISVAPEAQSASVGRMLMEEVLRRADEKRFVSVRLVQVAFNTRSMALYTKLGFDIREPLACLSGDPILKTIPGHDVRPATMGDADACAALCRQVHGHDRTTQLHWGIQQGTALVVEHAGEITGYTSGIGFFDHAVARTNDDLKALIAAAPQFTGPGFLLPSRNADVFRWCLAHGLRIVQPMSLMSRGLYNEPSGAFLPSVLY